MDELETLNHIPMPAMHIEGDMQAPDLRYQINYQPETVGRLMLSMGFSPEQVAATNISLLYGEADDQFTILEEIASTRSFGYVDEAQRVVVRARRIITEATNAFELFEKEYDQIEPTVLDRTQEVIKQVSNPIVEWVLRYLHPETETVKANEVPKDVPKQNVIWLAEDARTAVTEAETDAEKLAAEQKHRDFLEKVIRETIEHNASLVLSHELQHRLSDFQEDDNHFLKARLYVAGLTLTGLFGGVGLGAGIVGLADHLGVNIDPNFYVLVGAWGGMAGILGAGLSARRSAKRKFAGEEAAYKAGADWVEQFKKATTIAPNPLFKK